jgi:hypothetical protein
MFRERQYNDGMSAFSSDTRPEAEVVLIHLLRETPSWRKIEMVGQMNATVRTIMISGLKNRYPHDPPELLHRRLADLLLGPRLAMRVYGPLRQEQDGK